MKALAAVIACILIALAVLQFGSMALLFDAASAASFPAHLNHGFGENVYRALERIAPSDTVEAMLAQDDLGHRRLQDAQDRVRRMAPGAQRSELQARIATARGKTEEALRAYLAADDVDALQLEVDRLARSGQMVDAYQFERHIVKRLASRRTHPDALAEAWWHLGELASWLAARGPTEKWLRSGQRDYEQALELAPFSEKYLLAAGFQALTLRNATAASTYLFRAIDVNPASAQAYAGLGELALMSGDRTRARLYAARSHNLDRDTGVLRALERKLSK